MNKGERMEKPAMARLNVEVPKDLHRRAKLRAVETDRDLREIVIEALEAALEPSKPRKAERK